METGFFAAGDENAHLQLSVNSAFFRFSVIESNGLLFDDRVRPTFEDAHFVGRFLVALEKGCLAFLKGPRYYYRKRQNSSSVLDGSWRGIDRYLMASKYGSLDLLRYADKAKGYVPVNIQRTVLYDYSWFLKQFLDHPERSAWLERLSKQEEILSIWRDIFGWIDLAVIMDMPGSMLSYPHKYMTAGLFCYKEKLPYRISYVQRVDLAKRLICIEAYGDDISFYLDGEEVEPFEAKHVGHSFLGATLPSSRILWIPFESRCQVLSFRSPQREPQRLSVRNKQLHESTTIGKLLDLYCKDWGTYEQSGDTWIIMDRDTQADDNGEHFCRYMIKEHPEQRVLFALRKEAPQYEKLAREGFPLIEFGSKNYERELKACSKIISAHADAYVHSYFGDNFFQSKDFVFLQHGVTQNDISSWINPKPISLLVGTTSDEHESIVSDGSPYKFGKSQVLLSGFARHDALLERAESGRVDGSSCILIMPTWRKNLVGATLGGGNARSLSSLFAESAYRSSWEGFLWCDELRLLVDAGTRVVFFPHANMLPYVEAGEFSIPPYIEIGSCEGRSIQDYFCDADLCITDYTSAVFDVAYLGKPVIYYQFDQEEFFGGTHILAKGYFDYERDGFGPVVTSQEDLVREMQRVAQNEYEPDEVYAQRMRDAFPFRDGKCCERIYEAIKRLDEPRG